jgi:hypothetical protein
VTSTGRRRRFERSDEAEFMSVVEFEVLARVMGVELVVSGTVTKVVGNSYRTVAAEFGS